MINKKVKVKQLTDGAISGSRTQVKILTYGSIKYLI